jgi:hypothetical protein
MGIRYKRKRRGYEDTTGEVNRDGQKEMVMGHGCKVGLGNDRKNAI